MDVEQRAVEGEDDVFFAELKHRISLLIMEDEDNEFDSSFQALSYTNEIRRHYFHAPSQFVYDYETSCRKEAAKGTGVFIPALAFPPRRKNRSSRAWQAGRSRKTAAGQGPPSAARVAENLSSTYTPPTCAADANPARKHRHQLSTKKKGMAAMC